MRTGLPNLRDVVNALPRARQLQRPVVEQTDDRVEAAGADAAPRNQVGKTHGAVDGGDDPADVDDVRVVAALAAQQDEFGVVYPGGGDVPLGHDHVAVGEARADLSLDQGHDGVDAAPLTELFRLDGESDAGAFGGVGQEVEGVLALGAVRGPEGHRGRLFDQSDDSAVRHHHGSELAFQA